MILLLVFVICHLQTCHFLSVYKKIAVTAVVVAVVVAAVAAIVGFGVSAVVNGVCFVFAVKPVLGLDCCCHCWCCWCFCC